MATINVKVNSRREANKVLNKVYNVDGSSAYCNNRKSVSGSVLTATFTESEVEIHSNYYTLYSLNEMFNN